MYFLFHSVLKNKTHKLIKLLGNGYNEIVIDIEVDGIIFNSFELLNGRIYLNRFSDDLELKTSFDDLELDDMLLVYRFLFDIEQYKKRED